MTPSEASDYLTPVLPEEVATRCQCAVALVRLAIDCGLPCVHGRLCPADFAEWMAANYNLIRQSSGLPPLPDFSEGMTPAQKAQLTVRNTLRTYADYLASRTTSLELKQAAMEASNLIANITYTDV